MSSFYSHYLSPSNPNDDTLLVTLIGYSLEDSWKMHWLYGHKSFVKLFYQVIDQCGLALLHHKLSLGAE